MDKAKLIPYRQGACRVCWAAHGRDEPHMKDSLHYLYRFRAKHGRFPTWRDALRHLSPEKQEEWAQKLRDAGERVPEETGE